MNDRRGLVVAVAAVLGAISGVSFADRSSAESQVIAFPGAEGFGRWAKGGRGGDVYHVSNLNDDGDGSLRHGIRSASGPRTIVFDVAGNIELTKPLVVDKSYLTLAGQTAPGMGVCLKGQTFQIKKASHVIVRYLRFRLGDERLGEERLGAENKPRPWGPDCVNTDDIDHVMFDHLSVSWGIDGNHDLRRGGHFTLQWSIYAEALHHSLHPKGPHAMLASFRDLTSNITLHHNLWASSRERHPTLGGSPRTNPKAIVDVRNNVIYNVVGAMNLCNCPVNVINNTFLPGPNTPPDSHPIATKSEAPDACRGFLQGNVFWGRDDFTRHNERAIDFGRWTKGNYRPVSPVKFHAPTEFDVGSARPRTQTAQDSFETVLEHAGASLRRDRADARLVEGVRTRTHRMIDSPKDVGGWPVLEGGPARVDSDRDGMADDWERAVGLDPKNPNDGPLDRDGDGYTNLEEFLNQLVPSAPRG